MGYGSDLLDIVTAYKSLKLAMNKNLKGLEKGREFCQGKNYLKPTINSNQVARMNLGLPPLGESTQGASTLPQIRGQTAPAAFMHGGARRRREMGTSSSSRGIYNKTKGMDG